MPYTCTDNLTRQISRKINDNSPVIFFLLYRLPISGHRRMKLLGINVRYKLVGDITFFRLMSEHQMRSSAFEQSGSLCCLLVLLLGDKTKIKGAAEIKLVARKKRPINISAVMHFGEVNTHRLSVNFSCGQTYKIIWLNMAQR